LPDAAQTDLEDDEFGEFGDGEAVAAEDAGAQTLPDTANLSLQLDVGQRFPLMKTVEQRLTQVLPSGVTVGHSRLDLQLSLSVEEVRGDRRRLGVRYHRVRYQQDLGGQSVEYNSDMPSLNIPPEAVAYAGLKDNGFSFWIGADNQVLELVGFPDFLRRCAQHVPVDQRAAVMHQLQTLRTEDGLASFVDDSIGLLPGAQLSGLRVGSSWDLAPRTVSLGSGPGSTCTLRCLLKDLTDKSAEISLVGSIGPSSYTDELRRVRLTVRNGQCTGQCTVDRTTGMPTRSRVERLLDMVAQLPDGTEIPQRKEVITTITAFLEQSAVRTTSAAEPSSRGAVQSAYATEPASAPRWSPQ
jgi:hypothetical protein